MSELLKHLYMEARFLFALRYGVPLLVCFYAVFVWYHLFFINVLQEEQLYLVESLRVVPWMLGVLIPYLGYSRASADFNQGQFEVFLSGWLPTSLLVGSRYVVQWCFACLILMVCWLFLLCFQIFGTLDSGTLRVAFSGYALLSGVYLAMVILSFSFFRDRFIAFLFALGMLFLLNLSRSPVFIEVFPDMSFMSASSWVWLLPGTHVEWTSMGQMPSHTVGYFSLLIVFFITGSIYLVHQHRLGARRSH